MIIFEIALWLAVGYVVMSAVEYVIHRWFMHQPVFAAFYERHAAIHHGYYRGERFSGCPDRAARYVGIDAPPLLSFLGLAPIWLPVFHWSHVGGITLAAFFTLHAAVWTAFHSEMHEPSKRWFGRTAYFQWVASYHAAHHVRRDRNFTALCPLFDLIFGTYAGVSRRDA